MDCEMKVIFLLNSILVPSNQTKDRNEQIQMRFTNDKISNDFSS